MITKHDFILAAIINGRIVLNIWSFNPATMQQKTIKNVAARNNGFPMATITSM